MKNEEFENRKFSKQLYKIYRGTIFDTFKLYKITVNVFSVYIYEKIRLK